MKATHKCALVAVGLGIAAGLGTWLWLLRGAAWWIHPALAVLVAAGAYQGLVRQTAAERLADGE